MAIKTSKTVPDEATMTPPVYEQGANVGPDIGHALQCEHLDADLYRSARPLWRPEGARGVYGGQVIGQALTVSNASVDEKFHLHSFHSYFLLAGDEQRPIYFYLSRLRDGGSYVTRLVEAKQKGRCIFVLFSSYAKPEAGRPRFAIGLPKTISPGGDASQPAVQPASNGQGSNGVITHVSRFSAERVPFGTTKIDGLIPYEQAPLTEARYKRVFDELSDVLPQRVKSALQAWIRDRQHSAVEIRDALPDLYDHLGIPNPGHEQAFWMRCRAPVQGGDGAQKAALAYASDMNFLGTIPKALGVSRSIKMMASLDHSMHFYEPFDFHQPILFFMAAQVASNGRGLVIGRFYTQDGTLVGMASQEGMVRPREDKGDNLERAMKESKL